MSKQMAKAILRQKLYTGQRLKRIWMRKKSCSIWKKTLQIQQLITGRTNTDLENQGTSIAFILVTSGINIIKPITSASLGFSWYCSLTFFSTDNPPPKVVQGYKVSHFLAQNRTTYVACSSISFIRTLSISRKRQHTKLSKSRVTKIPYCFTLAQDLHTKTSLSGLSIVNGSILIKGFILVIYELQLLH